MYLIYENEFNKNVHDEQDKLIRWINEAARLNPKAPLNVILSAAKAYVDGKHYAVSTLDGRFMGSNEPVIESEELVEEEVVEEINVDETPEEENVVIEEVTVEEEPEVEDAIQEMEEELHPVETHAVSQEESAEETPEEEEFISEKEDIEATVTVEEYLESNNLSAAEEKAIIAKAAEVVAEDATLRSEELAEEYLEEMSEEEERQLLSVGEKKASINDAIDFSKRKKSRGSALAALQEEAEDDAIEAVIEERQDRKKRKPTTYNTGDEKQSRIRDNLVAIYTNIDDLQDL